jgi:hypothetical protein
VISLVLYMTRMYRRFDEWEDGFKIEDPKRFGVGVRKLHLVKPRGTVKESHIAVVIWHCRTCHMKMDVICAWEGRLLTRVVEVLLQIMYVYLAS